MRPKKSGLSFFLKRYRPLVRPGNYKVSQVLMAECPDDSFSIEMWALGLSLYETKLKEIIPVGGSVLDIGCGTGTWTFAAARTANEVTAVDVSASRIAVVNRIATALQIPNVRATHGDVFSLNANSECYDAVICFNTLQFIKNYDEVLREIHRLLKPGGKFYCSVPDWGICALYLWESLYQFSPKKIIYVVKCVLKNKIVFVFGKSKKLNYYNGVYIRDSVFIKDVYRAGFQLTNASVCAGAAYEIFPKSFWKMPFFNEYNFEKKIESDPLSHNI